MRLILNIKIFNAINTQLSMKKFVKFIPVLLIALVGSMMLWSCDNDDTDDVISTGAIPTAAKAFIEEYFPTANIISATKDKNEYEVILSDGTHIDFNKSGEWTAVEAPVAMTVPTGFYPADIDAYIEQNYPESGINEISKEKRGFDVELTTGIELVFNSEGSFIGIDK